MENINETSVNYSPHTLWRASNQFILIISRKMLDTGLAGLAGLVSCYGSKTCKYKTEKFFARRPNYTSRIITSFIIMI